jgi:hypothetical protein
MEHFTQTDIAKNKPPSVDCARDPIGSLVQMLVQMVQEGRIKKGKVCISKLSRSRGSLHRSDLNSWSSIAQLSRASAF